jgi:DNA-binding beta-propeller fold protein YncE
MRFVPILSLSLALAPGLAACGDDGGSGNPDAGPDATTIIPIAPTGVTMVASGGFTGPMDAVATPDGSTFYFSAYDTNSTNQESTASIFRVPANGGAVEVVVGGPPLGDPSGLLMSCDGTTLYIADLSFQSQDAADAEDQDKSALFTLDLATGQLSALASTGIGEAAGLAFDTDCTTLYVTGYDENRAPALFTLQPEGGQANALASGAPLESPSGVYVDQDNIAWVMDHRDSAPLGGMLWAIDDAGTVTEVIGDLAISEPAGVSLVAGGRIAVIPARDANGAGQLITVDTVTGDQTIVAAPAILEPAGIRTAIAAPVMAVVDTDGDAIFKAE